MIYLFDGGAHRRFCGGDRFAYLDGQKLHPLQFSELVARIFYDQTVLDPAACQVTYLWNRDANAVIARILGPPARQSLSPGGAQPGALGPLVGFLHLTGSGFAAHRQRRPVHRLAETGRFIHAVRRRNARGDRAALQEPGQHRLGAYKGDAIRTRLAEDAWTAPGRGAVER